LPSAPNHIQLEQALWQLDRDALGRRIDSAANRVDERHQNLS
jgi:hypothetical protein